MYEYTEVCEVVSRFPSKFDFEKLTFCFAKWCLKLALNITKNSQMSVVHCLYHAPFHITS